MGDETYKLIAKISADTTELSSGLDRGINSIESFASKIVAIAGAIGLGKIIGDSVKEGGDLEQSLGGIETLFKDSADEVKKNADDAFKTTGLSANEYMENVTGFSASLLQSLGGDTKKAADISNMAMIDMADNSNKMGTSMQDIQNAYQGFAKQNYTMLDNLKLGYGGTKKEMERLLADAEKITGVKYDINSLSDVYNAVHVIQGELGITGTTAKEAEDTLTGSAAAMGAAFDNLKGKIALGENVDAELNALAETTSTFLFNNLIPMIINILSALPGAVVTFLQTTAPLFIEGGMGIINNLIDGMTQSMDFGMIGFTANFDEAMNVFLSQVLPEFLQNGVDLILSLVDGLLQGLPNVIEGIGSILSSLITFLLEAIPQLIESGIKLIGGLAKGLIDNAPEVIKAITDVIVKLVKTILDELPEFLKKGFEIIKNIAKGLKDNAPEAIDKLIEIIDNLITTIRDNLPEFLEKGWEIIKTIAKGIMETLPEILESMASILVTLIEKIVDYLPEFLEKGWDIVKELAKGILNMASEANEAMRDIISGVIDKISEKIDRFFDKGKELISNLASGISDGADWVSDRINDIIKIFDWLWDIDLFNAGKNIMTSFYNGLVDMWNSVTDFVGDIGQWIYDHKGPISYDKKLLIPAGQAIMEGFNKGLSDSFIGVQKNILGMGESLYNLIPGNIDANLGVNNSNMNNEILPAYINLSFGGHSYETFVEDITNEQNRVEELETV